MNKISSSPITPKFCASEFFVLRTPRMSEDDFLDWQGPIGKLRQQLKEWVSAPAIKEALYLATPSLCQRLHYWFDKPNSERGIKIEQSLTKYFVRMTTRCTPFGLFAGIGTGQIKAQNHLALENIFEKRHSRLDSLILFELKQQLLSDRTIVNQIFLKPNQSLYLLGKRYRFIEAYNQDNKRHYQLSSFTNTPYIQHILDCCAVDVTPLQVADSLCQFDSDITQHEAQEFIFQLVKNSILEPQLPFYLTHDQAEQIFIKSLKNLDIKDPHVQESSKILQDCLALLALADQNQPNELSHYANIQSVLKKLPIETKESKSIQTDLYIGDANLALSQRFCHSLNKDLSLLGQISPEAKDIFSQFKLQFIERYEYQAVPLKEVLDDESGIGFSQNHSIESPLLAGVPLFRNEPDSQTRWTELDSLLMTKFRDTEFDGKQEIRLEQEDVTSLTSKHLSKSKGMTPASIYGLINLYADSAQSFEKGNYRIGLSGISGPSVANMLGRFCHLDDGLKKLVSKELTWEAKQYNGAILAEIVHLPEGRVGNVIARPVLRKHEISFLSDQNSVGATQISLDDLYVYIEGDKVKLWSKSHNKEIIPRLSCAHNYNKNSLGIYRFLASLQYQNAFLPRFNLPKPIQQMPYFPRVTLGKLVLSPQRWRVPRKAFEFLSKVSEGDFAKESQQLSKKYRLSSVLIFKRADLVLTLTLNNPLLVNMLLSETRGLETIVLEEKHPDGHRSPISKHGRITNHEILIPLRNSAFRYHATKEPPTLLGAKHQNHFLPGEEWLCAKIYVGYEAADQLLCNVLASWLIELKEKHIIENFFFLRYSDPDWHIRLRIQVKNTNHHPTINTQLSQRIVQAKNQGLVNRMEVIPYQRETQRYGGPEGMLIAEQLFTLDSQCCLRLLQHLPHNDPNYRWQVTMWGCEQLLKGLGFNEEQKYHTIQFLRNSYGKEFNESGHIRNAIGTQYKKHQQCIHGLLENNDIPLQFKHCHDLLIDRNLGLYRIGKELFDLCKNKRLTISVERIATSFLHMFTNRMLQHKGREHELLIYDFILRHYKQRKARERAANLNH